jgi:hypothetical protein
LASFYKGFGAPVPIIGAAPYTPVWGRHIYKAYGAPHLWFSKRQRREIFVEDCIPVITKGAEHRNISVSGFNFLRHINKTIS